MGGVLRFSEKAFGAVEPADLGDFIARQRSKFRDGEKADERVGYPVLDVAWGLGRDGLFEQADFRRMEVAQTPLGRGHPGDTVPFELVTRLGGLEAFLEDEFELGVRFIFRDDEGPATATVPKCVLGGTAFSGRSTGPG